MSKFSKQFETGLIWDWHHDGASAGPQAIIEFTDNHQIRWGNGGLQGSWKLID